MPLTYDEAVDLLASVYTQREPGVYGIKESLSGIGDTAPFDSLCHALVNRPRGGTYDEVYGPGNELKSFLSDKFPDPKVLVNPTPETLYKLAKALEEFDTNKDPSNSNSILRVSEDTKRTYAYDSFTLRESMGQYIPRKSI